MLFGLLQCPHGRDQKPLRFARMTAELHKAKGRRRGGSRKSTLDNPGFLCHIQRLSNPLNDPHEQQLKDGEGWTLSFMKKIEKYCITQSDGSHEKTRQFCLMLHQVISSSTAF